MRKFMGSIILGMGMLVFHGVSLACSPIAQMSLEGAVQLSDLIIIGEQVAEGPERPHNLAFAGGFEWIDVKVVQTLKGEAPPLIRLGTDGPCGSGPHSLGRGKRALFFLQKKNDRHVLIGPGDEAEKAAFCSPRGQDCQGPQFIVSSDGIIEDPWGSWPTGLDLQGAAGRTTVNAFAEHFELKGGER